MARISGCRTARQRRALPDARGRYAARGRVTATVTGGRRFVVTVLSGANDVGATAPGQRAGGRVRVVLDLQTRVVVVVRRTFGRRPCGRQVGGLLPDQSGRRQVPGRPRSTDGAILVTAAPTAATAAAHSATATATVQRARTAAVRRSQGGCRVRSGQCCRRGRHRVHDRGRPRVQRRCLFPGAVRRVVAPVVVAVVTIVRRNDWNKSLGRYVVSTTSRILMMVILYLLNCEKF